MLQNAYSLAKIGADRAENERNVAEICQKLATTRRVAFIEAAAAPRSARQVAAAPSRAAPATTQSSRPAGP